MPLREEFAASGAWLFRHRSYLPLLALAAVLLQLPGFSYLGGSHATNLLWEALCLAIGLFGLAIRFYAGGYAPPGTSARGTRAPAASQVSTTGLYSVVRHPLYLANMIMWTGVVLFVHVWWLVVLVGLASWCYYERIMFAEEEMLRATFGADYLAWAARTPALLPRLRLWRAPACPFCLGHALRREYAGLFALIASFTLLEIAADLVVTGRLQLDPEWGVLFATSLVLFLVFRWLTHHTRVLDIPSSPTWSEAPGDPGSTA